MEKNLTEIPEKIFVIVNSQRNYFFKIFRIQYFE